VLGSHMGELLEVYDKRGMRRQALVSTILMSSGIGASVLREVACQVIYLGRTREQRGQRIGAKGFAHYCLEFRSLKFRKMEDVPEIKRLRKQRLSSFEARRGGGLTVPYKPGGKAE